MPKSRTSKTTEQKKGKKGGATGMHMPSQTFIVGAAGAALGAAIGGAAAVALTNQKTRKMVGSAMESVADYAGEAVETLDTVSQNTDKLKQARTKLGESIEKPSQKKVH